MTTIAPGGSWDGTITWGGRSVPSASGTPYGSGWTQSTIAGFDEAPYQWWDADFDVTVLADHGDGDWIDHVEFWLEGATATVSSVTKNSRTGGIGFVCTISPPAGTDGNAELYATVVPVNGYERVIGPLKMVFNKGASITRTVKTVKTSGGDYTTIRQAVDAASDGWIIKVDAGTWSDDTAAASFTAFTYGVEVRAADGLSAGDVVIARSSRNAWRSVKRTPIVFRTLKWDAANITQIYDPYYATFIDCAFEDSNGVTPQPGYRYPLSSTTFFRPNDGQHHSLIDCTLAQPNTSAPDLMRGCSMQCSHDAWAAVKSGDVRLDCDVTVPLGRYGDRQHDESTVTVSTSTYDGGTGRTTITWADTPTLETMTTASGGRLFVDDGAGGWTDTAVVYSQTPGSYQTVVVGDYTTEASVGVVCWVANTAHVDTMQTFPGLTTSNVVAQRYRCISAGDPQPIFFQAGSGFETKDVAIQVCIFDADSQSQWQHGVTNVVMRQTTHVNSNLLGRNDMGGWSLSDNVVVGCLFESCGNDAAFGSGGVTFTTNHFITGTAFGTDTSTGDPLIDSGYRPQSGSDLLGRLSNPIIPWDAYGDPYGESAAVGAVSGGTSTTGGKVLL